MHKERLKMSDVKIEYVKLSDLKVYDKNARMHSEQQILQVMNSISEFTFTNPVLIDENNVLIAGHGRSMAAERLGMVEVPAIRLIGLTEEKRKALRIADNQIALNSTWDYDLLARELQDLQLANYGLDVLGFSDEEINKMLDNGFDDVEAVDPTLKSGERDTLASMTFTLSVEQKNFIDNAISKVPELACSDPQGVNENNNGNALYFIIERYQNGFSVRD